MKNTALFVLALAPAVHSCPAAIGQDRFQRGDANAYGGLDISDPVFLLTFLFIGGQAPPCLDSADVDDNGILQITNTILILNFLFLGEMPPRVPFAEFGLDPTDDDGLSCEPFVLCQDSFTEIESPELVVVPKAWIPCHARSGSHRLPGAMSTGGPSILP